MEVILHLFFAIILLGPIFLALLGLFKWKNVPINQGDKKWNFTSIVINSSVLYALTYNVIYFIQELFLASGKKWIGLKAYLYHNNHNWIGEDPRHDLMQGLGALVIFILGVILLLLFFKIRKSNHWSSFFVLWLAHHGLIQSLPQLSSVPFDRRSDVGQSITYLQLGSTFDFIISYASIIAIIALAYGFSKWFMQFAPPQMLPDHGFKIFRTIFFVVLLPAIIGTIILFPYRIMPVDRYQMTAMLLVVCVPSILSFLWMIKDVQPIENEVNQKIVKAPILLSILMLLFFQLVLAPGIVFE